MILLLLLVSTASLSTRQIVVVRFLALLSGMMMYDGLVGFKVAYNK